MENLGKFSIELDNLTHVYSPGDRVTGRVYIQNKVATKINKIIVEIKGDALVNW